MSNRAQFLEVVQQAVENFPSNQMCRKLDAGSLAMPDYHAILLMIFHQTFEGPSTFALAGAHCPPRLHEVRDYLLQHADEEKSHWQWVINDLQHTGYTGPDPRTLFPQTACQAYIAFNIYTALRQPVARLAIAATLESIGANHGKQYATKLCQQLALKPQQASFFYGHGDTDVGHTAEILEVLDRQQLSAEQWDWMCHAARTAGHLYTAMYDEALA
jgi:heme oxygenase